MSKLLLKKIDIHNNMVYLLKNNTTITVRLEDIIDYRIIDNLSSEEAFTLGIKYQEYHSKNSVQ